MDPSASMKIDRSAGSCVLSSFTFCFTRAATSSGLAPGASVIEMNTVSLPLEYYGRLVGFARELDLRDVAER